MKKVIPELHLNDCAQAIEYYKDVFGAEVKNVQMADNVPGFENSKGKVLHAELFLSDECVIYLADQFNNTNEGSNITLVIECDSEEEIKMVYNNFSKEGTVRFPLQKTFWGALHAVITDKVGVTWGLNFMLKP